MVMKAEVGLHSFRCRYVYFNVDEVSGIYFEVVEISQVSMYGEVK